MNWEVAEIAPDQITAEIWVDILQQNEIPAMIEPRDAVSFLGVSPFPCRVMVPADVVSQAKKTLQDYLQPAE